MASLKKGTPGQGDEGARRDSFSYTPVLHGLKNFFSGWIAGETYWCTEAHEHTDKDPGTKPCLHWLTDGALPCARCRRARPLSTIGWCPLYREQDAKPIIVILHKNAYDLVRELRYGELAIVGRVDAKSSVFVRRAETQLVMRTELEHRKRAVDITDDLLMMWRMPELNEWLKQNKETTPRVKCEQVGAEKWRLSVTPPVTENEKTAHAAHRAGDGEGESGVDDALQRAVRRAKPSTNGDGKH